MFYVDIKSEATLNDIGRAYKQDDAKKAKSFQIGTGNFNILMAVSLSQIYTYAFHKYRFLTNLQPSFEFLFQIWLLNSL